MDPLSITATVITVLGALQNAGTGLHKLLQLRAVPAVVLALNNEISDLQLLFREIDSLLTGYRRLRSRGSEVSSEAFLGLQSLPTNVNGAKVKIAELQAILDKHLTNSHKLGDKISWLKEEARVCKIHEDIRSVRINIATALGVLTSSSSLRIQLQMQDLQLVIGNNQTLTKDALMRQNTLLETTSLPALKAQDSIEQRMQRIERQLLAVSERLGESQKSQPSFSGSIGQDSLIHYRPPVSSSTTDFSFIDFQAVQRARCSPLCWCACHRERRVETPSLLRSIVGYLYIGYTGIPKLTPSCNDPSCYGNSPALLNVHYFFPRWLISHAVFIAVRSASAGGPEFCLRVANVRDPSCRIFTSAFEGDTITVRSLLMSKKASVLDIEKESGQSPLHLALFKSRIETVKVLLQFGAQIHQENSTHETPDDMIWNSILCFQGTRNSSLYKTDALLKISPNPDRTVERRRLTRVHQIVLQMLHIDLEEELCFNPIALDRPDVDGRTPLHWAAARGDSKIVRLLLKYGASPNAVDRISQGPLRSSMKATDPTCMKLLLKAGANVDQRDQWNQTCLQSAMYYPDPTPFVVPLLDAGADINARDIVGYCPILEACLNNHTAAMEILLSRGCNLNVTDGIHGMSPLHWAIRHNHHDIISNLLRLRDLQLQPQDKFGQTTLHIAAKHADARTLRLLSHAKLRGLSKADKSDEGLTALDIAEIRHRRDDVSKLDEKYVLRSEPLEWNAAFLELLKSIVATNNAEKSGSRTLGTESDSDDTASYHSALDHVIGEVSGPVDVEKLV